jgi:copper chaperone
MTSVDIAIDGMHCDGCVKRATEALKKVPGLVPEKVEIGRARVQVDEGNATAGAAVAALEKLGFDARVEG